LIQLEGVESPESAAEFRGQLLLIRESQRVELPEGEFYFSDLEGLDVLSQEGEKVGRVIRVEEHPSVNSFLLEIGTTQLYAPWIDDCILKIDLEKKNIEVNLAFLQELLEEGPPEGDRS
jgi:16S rRNA processing protein RimM